MARLFLLLGLLLWAGPAQADACTALSRLMGDGMGPRFLPSYPAAATPQLKDVAFLYDNGAAAIALVACGERARAARIGDAMLLALAQDRHWRDGRLRNAYPAGAVETPAKLPGWWDAKENRWAEDRYQVGSDSGNLAWAMLALLALDDGAADRRYREGAARIGAWLLQSQISASGFRGGALGHEPAPQALPWKSTEHNVDLAAAFAALARASGEKRWKDAAGVAQRFAGTMWMRNCNCFAAGTGADGVTPNPLLALDAQVLPLMALPGLRARRAPVLATIRARLASDGGYAYSMAAKGLWSEGTAQMALLLRLSGHEAEAARALKALEPLRAADGLYYAAARTIGTGFDADGDPAQARQYFRLTHLGATAWVALAEGRTNPFTGRRALP